MKYLKKYYKFNEDVRIDKSNLQNLSFLELYDKQMQSIDVTNRKSFADYQLQPQYMHGQQPPPPPKHKI